MVTFDSIPSAYWNSLGLSLLTTSFEGILSQFTIVYAATTSTLCRVLWCDLLNIRSNTTMSWMAIGDFNTILGAHEQMCGHLPARTSCENFRSTIELCDFTHMDTTGAFYTWTNGWSVHGYMERRLDRSLCDTRPQLFRFQSIWTLHLEFFGLVAKCWQSTVVYGCPMFVMLEKLKALKRCLRVWNSNVFGDVHRNVTITKERLHNIQNIVAKTAVLDALQCKKLFGMSVLGLNGSLRVIVIPFFSMLMLEDVCGVIPPMVSEEQNLSLSCLPLADEIRSVVFSMDPFNAPGPDGFPGSFYQSCWDIVGLYVIAFVQDFFKRGWLYPNANCNFVVLIPNVSVATIAQYRPITLANFLFKIIPKILADRLGPIATRVISPQQTTFLKGRQEFNFMDKKAFGGNVGIKVDIAKAFDSLNWDFLLHVLSSFGFSSIFMDWLRVLLQSARLSILVNGTPHGFIFAFIYWKDYFYFSSARLLPSYSCVIC
ncbi:unnamed protein product [Malus baccata var. baccata]